MANWRFGAFPKLPYSTMQQLNLDWILDRIRRFLPDAGTIGQVLTRTKDGAAWQDAAAGGGAVDSVNGQTGDVVLDAEDVGALPDTYTAPVTSVNEQTGDVDIDTGVMSIEFVRQDGQVGTIKMADSFVIRSLEGISISANKARTIMLISANKSTIGLGNVDNVRQYSANNPPPYPVTSVNGQTGAVVIPTGGAVNSVNGQTGTVVLDAEDVGALPDTYTAPVTSVNGQTGDVVVQAGGTEIAYEDVNLGSVTIASRSVENVTGSIAKTGYTPIGVIGANFPGTTVFVLGRCEITGNTIDLYVYNTHASASRSSNVVIRVLYIKN